MSNHYVRLTENFALWEFLRSSTVPEIAGYDPENQEMANITRLAMHMQEPRDKYGRIKVTGGARPLAVRDAKGRTFVEALRAAGYPASETSQHHFFCAADIVPIAYLGERMWDVFKFLAASASTNQLIIYLDDDGVPKFIHTSIHDFLNPEKGKHNPRLVHRDGNYEPWS